MFRRVPLSIIRSFSLHTQQTCVYSEKLLMMDRGTVRNMQRFIPKINFGKLMLLVGCTTRILNMFFSGEEESALEDYAVVHIDSISFLLNRTHNTRADVGMEVQLHPFLNSAQDIGEWRASRSGRVNLEGKPLNKRLAGLQSRCWRFGKESDRLLLSAMRNAFPVALRIAQL